MATASFKRYEKKYLLTEAQYKAILPVLIQYMRPDEYCRDEQEYSIYNIYYDTDDASVIRYSLSKPYYKEKLRLRSYNIPNSADSKVFLELKKKIGGIVSKRRAVMTLAEAYAYLADGSRPENLDYMNTQVLNEISYYLRHHAVKPACYISYDRTALFGREDNAFRITFDHNIITRREELRLEKGRFGDYLLDSGIYLMEVKVAGAFPVWLAALLSENKIYKTSFSKYGYAYKQNKQQSLKPLELRTAI